MAAIPSSNIYLPKQGEMTQRNKICQAGVVFSGLAAVALITFKSREKSFWAVGSVAVISTIFFLLIKYIDTPGERGRTTLHKTAMNGQLVWSRVLLFFGANPNTRDNRGYTSVAFAAGSDNEPLLKMLIEAGGNVQTVFRIAIQDLRPVLIEHLLTHKANPQTTYEDSHGDFPLAHAERIYAQVMNEGYMPGDASTQEDLEKDAKKMVDLLGITTSASAGNKAQRG